jgi:uncharacterized protein YndB with AHSA1/START domain
MSTTAAATERRSVVVERDIPHPPEKIWRALTQPPLIQEWLMKNDFMPVVGHDFKLSADWGAIDCRVTAVEPHKTLAYTWGAYGLESVVTWTLTPHEHGHPSAHGAGRFPTGPAAGLRRRQGWLAAVLRQPRTGLGAPGVMPAQSRRPLLGAGTQ